MKWLFAGLLLIHGLIHLMGFAKAFGYAELPQLTQSVSRPMGVVWLGGAGLFVVATVLLFTWPRGWWLVGAMAVVVSQIAVVSSWTDARAGTVANGLILVGAVVGFASYGPTSFRAEFEREVGARLAVTGVEAPLKEADLLSLPPAVRRYIAYTGALGQPRVRNFHATFTGRIRSGPTAPWMPFSGEQYNFYDSPARLFIIEASRSGLPFVAFHRFEHGNASMRVKAASLFPVVDARGPEMNKAETVTLLNDMCVFAPGSLVDTRIQWRELDPLQVEGTFTNHGIRIAARLVFNESGELVDFISDDRLIGSADGRTFTPMRWSTPLRDYRAFGAHVLSARGTGRWHPAGGEAFDYIEIDLQDIRYNLASARPAPL